MPYPDNHDTTETPSANQILQAALRSDLTAFIEKVFGTVSPTSNYLANWHIEAISHALMRCMNGDIKRLIITIPPRYLKSISASVAFPCFLLGHNPGEQIICASYSTDLALKHAADCRLVMSSHWYRALFPGTALSVSKDTQDRFVTAKNGFRQTTSVGSTLTGMGGNFLIIDDPINANDANSDKSRQKCIDWYSQTLVTRLNDKHNGVIILIQQRLHQDDLVGHLLEQGGWHHLNLPAIAEQASDIPLGLGRVHHREPGDILHPERESPEDLEKQKWEMGEYAFAAQYQQRPAPLGGGIVKLDWFNRYDWLKHAMHAECIVQSWDIATTANERSDWTVCTTWHVRDGGFYLVDLFRDKLEFPQLEPLVFRQAEKHHATHVVIEAIGAGQGLYQQVHQKRYRHDIGKFRLQYSTHRDDKATRLMKYSPLINQGLVHLPRHADWLDEFERELLNFPNGRHDDQVDSLALFLMWAWYDYLRRH